MIKQQVSGRISTMRHRLPRYVDIFSTIFIIIVVNLFVNTTCRQVQINDRSASANLTAGIQLDADSVIDRLTRSQKETERSNRNDSTKNPSLNRVERNIEFNSPIKRILELLGNHHHSPPVQIVVQSSSNQNEQLLQQQRQLSTLPTPDAAITSPMSSSDHHQHWTLISNQPQGNGIDPMASMLIAQPQQLIPQTSIPYERYFMATNNMIDGQQQPQQYAMLPSFDHSPSLISYENQQQPQISYLSTVNTNPEQQQQQQRFGQQQQANNVGESVQPIFLSSYVPELQHVLSQQQQQQQQPQTQQQYTPQTVSSNQPKSVQQVQQSQQTTAKQPITTTMKPSEQPETENSDSDEPTESAGNNNTPESGQSSSSGSVESRDSSSDPSNESDDSPSQRSSGSSSYEDKYDSDNDPAANGPQTESSKNYLKQTEATSDSMMALGKVGLNDDCMQCICRASSGCDHQLRCITRGSEEKYCGPFQLTEEYWKMAGSPEDSPNNFSSFEECANDIDCAVTTVTEYMKKYLKDCDGDNEITCLDYARLHRLKRDECSDTDKLVSQYDAYWPRFQNCAEGYNRTRNGDDDDIV